MSSKKRMAAVVITIAALSAGSIGVATAHDGAGKGVKNPAHAPNSAANQAAHDADKAAREALVSSTLGLDAATIKARLVAGETLAAIAGAKKDALVTALVALETKQIDARVTAGTMTAVQATAKKADLTAHVTAKINDVRGPGMGPDGDKGPKGPKGPKGDKGMGKGHKGSRN